MSQITRCDLCDEEIMASMPAFNFSIKAKGAFFGGRNGILCYDCMKKMNEFIQELKKGRK